MKKYKHLKEKAIRLRTENNMSLNEIVERLSLPKTTIYGWICDFPLGRPPRESSRDAARQKGRETTRKKHELIRQQAYDLGMSQAQLLLGQQAYRDFVVLYIAEGYKKSRNTVSICNSDPVVMQICNRLIKKESSRKLTYNVLCYEDHSEKEIQRFWGQEMGVDACKINVRRKSNSGRMVHRNWRSLYGVLTIRTHDTCFRSRLQAWIDCIKTDWTNGV